MRDPNLPLLELAAEKLQAFLDQVVFVGGATLGLHITDPASAPIRSTIDVDVIAEISTYADYIAFSERLRTNHFIEDHSEGAPACRWRNDKLILDVLPLDQEALGFTNIWYKSSHQSASQIVLANGYTIRVIRAPFFLATKMEAFRSRGDMDYAASHDLEDFIAVIEGRATITTEIAEGPEALKKYLAKAAAKLLEEPRFLDVLPGFVLEDDRVPLIQQRLAAIAQGKK